MSIPTIDEVVENNRQFFIKINELGNLYESCKYFDINNYQYKIFDLDEMDEMIKNNKLLIGSEVSKRGIPLPPPPPPLQSSGI